jgi:hypothetical protein
LISFRKKRSREIKGKSRIDIPVIPFHQVTNGTACNGSDPPA